MREAVRKWDKIDYNTELKKIYKEVKKGGLDEVQFNEQIKNLFRFWKPNGKKVVKIILAIP